MPADKLCESCGRTITWRKKWADDWDEVRYCSGACRSRGVTEADRALESDIVRGLRGVKELPLSDIAGDREAVRRAARRLAGAGAVRWVQRGRPVDPSTAKGDVGLRRG